MAQFDEAVEQIRTAILDGRLKPGHKLGAEEMATEYGMSRTPIREAFRVLASEGLVELNAGRGARVTEWTPEELDHVFETRMRLEGMAASLAADRVTWDEVERLQELAELIAHYAAPTPDRDLDAVQRLNGEFHSEIIRIAGSASLANAMGTVVHARVLSRTRQSFDEEAERRSSNHHLELVAALRAGDSRWAESTMHSHLLSARSSLLGPRREITPPPTNQEEAP